MSINTHINNWINKAEPDYYSMFIKAWIPYNAWYMHNFYDEDATPKRTSDKDIIHHIKTNSNKYKNRIIALLRGNDDLSIYFKGCLSKLHYELEAHPTPNSDDRISFDSICIFGNSLRDKTISQGRYTYKGKFNNTLPKTSPRWIFEGFLTSTNSTICRIELHKCSLSELRATPYFQEPGNDEHKKGIEACLNEINPNKKISIVVPPERGRGGKLKSPASSLIINQTKHLYFKDNIEDVSKVIIQILYELRCRLFHGEIDPTNANSGVFEQAFNIQKILIKELQ